jgi:hypothetical protein
MGDSDSTFAVADGAVGPRLIATLAKLPSSPFTGFSTDGAPRSTRTDPITAVLGYIRIQRIGLVAKMRGLNKERERRELRVI